MKPDPLFKKALLTNQELALKDAVDNCQKLHNLHVHLEIHPLHQYPGSSLLSSDLYEWVPPEFKGYNNRTFRTPNTDFILAMLEGRPRAKKWNNIHNASMHIASMHMMLQWGEAELHSNVCPEMPRSLRTTLQSKLDHDWRNSLRS